MTSTGVGWLWGCAEGRTPARFCSSSCFSRWPRRCSVNICRVLPGDTPWPPSSLGARVSVASCLSEHPVHSRRPGELLRGAGLQRPGEILHRHQPLQPGQAEHHALRVPLDVRPVGREAVRAGDRSRREVSSVRWAGSLQCVT